MFFISILYRYILLYITFYIILFYFLLFILSKNIFW